MKRILLVACILLLVAASCYAADLSKHFVGKWKREDWATATRVFAPNGHVLGRDGKKIGTWDRQGANLFVVKCGEHRSEWRFLERDKLEATYTHPKTSRGRKYIWLRVKPDE